MNDKIRQILKRSGEKHKFLWLAYEITNYTNKECQHMRQIKGIYTNGLDNHKHQLEMREAVKYIYKKKKKGINTVLGS